MMKKLSLAALSLIAVLIVTSIFLTRDGSLVTPQGVGKVVINGKDFDDDGHELRGKGFSSDKNVA